MAVSDQLAALLVSQARIQDAVERTVGNQDLLVAGTADDPASFNASGGKTGALGYYPVEDASGGIRYMPCLERQTALGQSAGATAAAATLQTFGFSGAAVSGHAMEIALLNAGLVQAIRDNLSSPPDEAAIRWNNGAPVSPGDALAAFIQTTLAYSDAQMAALFAAARQIA